MTIGDVFARAWDLWRRDVGWLILAGLVVGVILAVIFAVALGIFGSVLAAAGLSIGAGLVDDTASGISGLGVGLLAVGLIVYMLLLFLTDVLALTFYGGLFEMVIGAYRENRGVAFGDLFSGFRRFGAYALFALVMVGVSLGVGLLNLIPLVGPIVGLCVSIWIAIAWLYVLPLIADQGLGFGAAAARSNQMVKGAGWWWTFGMVVLLGLAAMLAAALILAAVWGVYKGDETAGIVAGLLLFLVFTVLLPPYMICYVSVLYIASGGDLAPAAVQAGGGLPGIPPAPVAPPPSGAPSYDAPAFGSPSYGPSAPPAAPAGGDAWRAAADPLATQPPAAPPPPPGAAGWSGAGSVGAPPDQEWATAATAAGDDADPAAGGSGSEGRATEPAAPTPPPAPPPPGS